MKKEEFDFYNRTSLKSYNLNEKMRYQLSMLDRLDNFTRKHCENVATITCRLCEYLHLDEGFTVYCTICAYLHDLGKLSIPPAVLQKPGKLTDEEFEIMKSHTTIGYKLCIEDPELRPYAAGAYYHHEALNGTGYPNKLKSKDIPYEAKIIRVADEYDAISSKRQYKTHVGIIDTLNILIENSNPTKSQSEDMAFLTQEAKLGKIDKTILRALFKVVIDDTEYEIYAKSQYLDHIKSEIKRLSEAEKYYKKMIKQKKEAEIEYYKNGILYLIKAPETMENFLEVLEQYREAEKLKLVEINKLLDEVKKIKRLRV